MVALRLSVCPEHTGVLLPAEGEEGDELTTTEVVPAAPVHPFVVIVKEYDPASAEETPATEGSSMVEVKLFGPVQAYVAPAMVGALKFRVNPAQMGLLLDMDGAAGV